jgi:hypothetical protein
MARLTKMDQMLLSEAYGVQLLEEKIGNMTLAQLNNNLQYMTLSEAVYVDEVIEEFFAGLKNLAGVAGQGLKAAGTSALNSVKDAAKNTAGAIGGVARGVGAAAGQLGKNTKEMYNTAEVTKASQQAVLKAAESANQLLKLVTDAQNNGLITAQKAVNDMTLAEIMDELKTATQSAQTFQGAANKQGFTGGVGQAYNKARNAAPAPAQAGAPAPAGAPATA